MAGHLTGLPQARHRVGVLPALPSRTEPLLKERVKQMPPILASFDEGHGNKQLVPLRCSHNKANVKSWTVIKSVDGDDCVSNPIHVFTTRVSTLEEANKAILEEVYKLQSAVRAGEYAKKEMLKEERRVQRELMETIRTSNEEIAQMTSRLRIAEEKLFQERENVKNLTLHSQKLEHILFSAQKEAESQRDAQNIQAGDMKNRMEDLMIKWEKNDHTSQNIVDEFHQLESKVEHQAMEFVHMLNDLKQRSEMMQEELKQALQQSHFQQDNQKMAEQSYLEMRQLFEARMSEVHDAIDELRARLIQTDNNARIQVQQLSAKILELQSNASNMSHRRQEELPNVHQRPWRRRCTRPPLSQNLGSYLWSQVPNPPRDPIIKQETECTCPRISPRAE